jgi:hypothetical protein
MLNRTINPRITCVTTNWFLVCKGCLSSFTSRLIDAANGFTSSLKDMGLSFLFMVGIFLGLGIA